MRNIALSEERSRKGLLPPLLAAFVNLAISILRLLETTYSQGPMRQRHLGPNASVALLLG